MRKGVGSGSNEPRPGDRFSPLFLGALALIVIAVLALAGCGGGGAGPTVATHRAPPPKPPSEIEEIEEEAELGRRREHRPRRLARPCGPQQLVVSKEGGAGAAMSTYYAGFTVFNLSEHACSIAGYPTVYALGRDGRTAEGPARQGTGSFEGPGGAVNVPGRRTASFTVSWSADVAARSACGSRIVAGYRVRLPGSNLVQTVPYPNFEHCTGDGGPGTMSVGRMQPSLELSDRLLEPPSLKEANRAEHLRRCDPRDLVVWQGIDFPGGAAAGTSYAHLAVTNLSDRACELSGIPRMVAVDLHGHPIGPPVGRSPSMPAVAGGRHIRHALVYPHGSAVFTFAVGEVLNYGAHGCEYEYAAGFDVTLPGASRPQYVPAPTRRCLHSVAPNGPQVSVGPIE
jgi:hypothetical protein